MQSQERNIQQYVLCENLLKAETAKLAEHYIQQLTAYMGKRIFKDDGSRTAIFKIQDAEKPEYIESIEGTGISIAWHSAHLHRERYSRSDKRTGIIIELQAWSWDGKDKNDMSKHRNTFTTRVEIGAIDENQKLIDVYSASEVINRNQLNKPYNLEAAHAAIKNWQTVYEKAKNELNAIRSAAYIPHELWQRHCPNYYKL